jgi:hypothetical protein
MIYLSVETRAPTAAGAGAENARIQTAVIAALRAKGDLAEHMTTSGYSVGPDERYDNGQRQVVGYIARNSVVVDVQKIGQVGTYIDVALGAGANAVGGLRYYSTKYEAIRRTALESAVSRASRCGSDGPCRGGSLGTPIEISANDAGGPRPMFDSNVRMARAVAEGAETPVAVGEQKVICKCDHALDLVPARRQSERRERRPDSSGQRGADRRIRRTSGLEEGRARARCAGPSCLRVSALLTYLRPFSACGQIP